MEKTNEFNTTKFFTKVSKLAVESLIEEVELTPKPGLVDQNDSGSHKDLSLKMMRDSAICLEETFYEIAKISYHRLPSQKLREDIAAIGRDGEQIMFEVTNGVNTHKGAIWALGLLISAISSGAGQLSSENILETAGQIASFNDRFNQLMSITNGKRVKKKYNVRGAKEQAEKGFPHILMYAIPALNEARELNMSENDAKNYVLLSLIANLDDTCILHRGGMTGLLFAKKSAMNIAKSKQMNEITTINDDFIERNISPGGSADLLAATIFLDSIHNMEQF